MALFVGRDDTLTVWEDTRALNKTMPNIVHYKEIYGFDHGRFMYWQDDERDKFFPDFLRYIRSYNPGAVEMHSLEGISSVKGGNSFKYQNWDRKYGMLKESARYNDE